MEISPQEQIMDVLFEQARPITLRELERETKLSIGSVTKYVRKLQKEGLVTTEKHPHAINVTLHREHENLRTLQQLSNLRRIHSLVNHLQQTYRPDSIVLFGSFARGEDTLRSDIDLAIVNGRPVHEDLKTFEKTLGRTIQLVTLKDGRKAAEEFKNTLANGIVVSGQLVIV